jgi:hypothetical protein
MYSHICHAATKKPVWALNISESTVKNLSGTKRAGHPKGWPALF